MSPPYCSSFLPISGEECDRPAGHTGSHRGKTHVWDGLNTPSRVTVGRIETLPPHPTPELLARVEKLETRMEILESLVLRLAEQFRRGARRS